MNELIERFERLLDSLSSYINDLDESAEKSNLEGIHDGLYKIFEDLPCDDIDELKEENEILKQLLTAHLSYEDKQYIRIKYDLDL